MYLHQFFDATGALHLVTRQLPGSIQGEHGIEAHNVHAQGQGGIYHLPTNCSETNNSQGLALNLIAHELGLVLLNALGNLLIVHLQNGSICKS